MIAFLSPVCNICAMTNPPPPRGELPPGAFTGDQTPDTWDWSDDQPITDVLYQKQRIEELNHARAFLPEALAQVGYRGCDAACVAYINRLLGDELTTPADVDAIFNRKPDDALNDIAANLWLLDKGLGIDTFSTPSADNTAMHNFLEGNYTVDDMITYNEGRTGQSITGQLRADYAKYYGSIMLSHRLNKSRFDIHRTAGKLHEHDDMPVTLDLVQRLVDEDKVVKCYLKSDDYVGASHTVLLFKPHGLGEMLQYDPAPNYATGQANPHIQLPPSNLVGRLKTDFIAAYYK